MKIIILFLSIVANSYAQPWYAHIPLRDHIKKDFKYIPGYEKKEVEEINDRKFFNGYKIILKSTHHESEGKPIVAEFYLHKMRKNGKQPIIILLPPILGITPGDRILAKKITRYGMHSIIFDFGDNLVRSRNEPEDINNGMYRGTIRFQMMMDYLEQEQKDSIDFEKTGIYGMSMGAVAGSMIMGLLSDKIKYAFLVAGGGDMPDIITHSVQSLVRKLRRGLWSRYEKKLGKKVNEDKFKFYLKKNLKWDPLSFANADVKNKMFLVVIKKNMGVPYNNQIKLWKAFNYPPRMLFNIGNHAWGVIMTLLKPQEIVRFFKESFEKGTTEGFEHEYLKKPYTTQ